MSLTDLPRQEDLLAAVRRFDVEDPELIEHPDRLFAAMRERCPVGRSDRHRGFWILSRYEDVRFVYQHPELFSSRGTMLEATLGQSRPLIPLEIDPPEHIGYRRLLVPLFSQSRVQAVEPELRAVVNHLIDGFAAAGHCEFVEQFARPLPSEAFVRFVGWPTEDAARFHDWAYLAIHGVGGEDDAGAKARGAGELYAYFRRLTEQRRREPTDDIISDLLRARPEQPLSDDEIVDICFLLVIAGFDSTRKVLGAAVAYMAEHPDARDKVVADPGLIPTTVEELLRWESRLAVVRTLNEDVELSGVRMSRGDRILVPTGSAGRDQEAYGDDADEVRLDRKPNHHFAFGAGAHRCLGIHFARTEIRIALEELLRRLPDFTCAPGTEVVRSGGYLPGVDRLELSFTAERA